MASSGGGGGASPSLRGQWGTRLGFILAASGSAVGLGNIWGFPFMAGQSGGGLFVLFYLACVAVIGLPVMIAEIMVGRRAQRSPVGAYGRLSGDKAMWKLVGWMGVAAGVLILSFYSVIAGWTLDYTVLSIRDAFAGRSPGDIEALFAERTGERPGGVIFLHALFMVMVIAIVAGGVEKGLERAVRILMPLLFVLIVGLLIYGTTLEGFGEGARFLFVPDLDEFDAGAALAALGQSMFSLSLGMGAILTYGSYLRRKDDIVATSTTISLLDTFIAVAAGMILFPIVFTYDLGTAGGEGLIFEVLPAFFENMPAGQLVAIVFFALLFFAALTSALSLLEVVTATVIDQLGWRRLTAAAAVGGGIFVLGLPSAHAELLPFWEDLFGMGFQESLVFLIYNVFLPLGGLLISVFAGWVLTRSASYEEFTAGSRLAGLYPGWLILVRFIVPIGILLVFVTTWAEMFFPDLLSSEGANE